MRRFAWALILALFLTAGALVSRASSSPQPSPTSDQLREAANRLLQSHSPDDTAKAADLLQKASQIDLAEAQTRNLGTSLWTTLAPLLTTLVLAGTLLLNIYTARRSEQEKRADTLREEAQAEKKRYADALELLQKSTSVSPAAALINSFSEEPFRSGIRTLGRTVLLSTKSTDEFRDLFNTLYTPITEKNLGDAKEILRSIHTSVSPLLTKTWTDNTNDTTKLTPEELAKYNLLTDERMFAGEKIATFIRQPHSGSPDILDFKGLGFDSCDFSGANLRGARISNSTWNYINFDGCDLRGITEFTQCWLYSSAWWHASYIDKPLLDYLKINQPFRQGMYVNTRQSVSDVDYAISVGRLEAASAQPATIVQPARDAAIS